MSIYDKRTDEVSTADLQELLAESAVENLRLEFKSKDVDKVEALKKITSFANTFGGYMVIGAEADKNGRIVGLPGVGRINGFKQRMIDWAYRGTFPPVLLFVSDAIPSPEDAMKVCYVVFVAESEEAPHFINGRKGAYVRTDEFSQRFDSQLATYEEIEHLAKRRAVTVTRRDRLIKRARVRLGTFLESIAKPSVARPVLTLSICPLFPSKSLTPHAKLLDKLGRCRIPWRSTVFPLGSIPISQHESAIILGVSEERPSLVEGNTWGLLFYAHSVHGELGGTQGIHLWQTLGCILVTLEHAKVMYQQLGFEGTLLIRTRLEPVRGLPLLFSEANDWPKSPLDDSVEVDVISPSDRLKAERDTLAIEIIRLLMFALNWPEMAVNEGALHSLLKNGYQYNSWSWQQTT
ncbi:MAG: ATP-binding protein [Terriglobia bacterium]|jgi:hypothetical protein